MNSEEALSEWRPELISYIIEMAKFKDYPDSREVLRELSAYSARASLMRNQVSRSTNSKLQRFRIDEVDPFLTEVDRQFKIFSRLISADQFEWDTTK